MVRFGEKGGAMPRLFILWQPSASPPTVLATQNFATRISTKDQGVYPKPFYTPKESHRFVGP